jgi:catechol 2,3-dioxygenase-like lactoylglutathione lyase family enzyme
MATLEAKLKDELGVPEFFVFHDIKFAEVTYRGVPASCRVSVATGYSGSLQIEIVEPISGEGAYSEFLESGREGLHHVATLVDDFDAAMERVRSSGQTVIQTGVIGDERAIRFAYVDTQDALGIVTEILWLAPSMIKVHDGLRRRALRRHQRPVAP